MKKRFHHHEPIRAEEVVHLITYLQQELAPLFNALKIFPFHQLIGASGSFDNIADLISENIHGEPLNPTKLSTALALKEIHFCYEKLVRSTFFFSSRRRHTRWNCDWSSDVCSSD